MTIANATEDAILKLVFQAVAWTSYAQNGTTPETSISVGLHTADPADAGTMATSEAAYTSYARASVARTAGGWAVSGTAPTECKPIANIDFTAGTGGGESVTFFSTGKVGAAASAQPILWSGAVSPAITTGSGITPRLTTATSIQLD